MYELQSSTLIMTAMAEVCMNYEQRLLTTSIRIQFASGPALHSAKTERLKDQQSNYAPATTITNKPRTNHEQDASHLSLSKTQRNRKSKTVEVARLVETLLAGEWW